MRQYEEVLTDFHLQRLAQRDDVSARQLRHHYNMPQQAPAVDRQSLLQRSHLRHFGLTSRQFLRNPLERRNVTEFFCLCLLRLPLLPD